MSSEQKEPMLEPIYGQFSEVTPEGIVPYMRGYEKESVRAVLKHIKVLLNKPTGEAQLNAEWVREYIEKVLK